MRRHDIFAQRVATRADLGVVPIDVEPSQPSAVSLLRVLADNPAVVDLLGLEAVARAVADVVCADNSEPVTVGLHGPWGSGKSSLLGQVRSQLRWRGTTVIVELNPWEFDDQEDVKGTIIATVLDELMKNSNEALKGKLGKLIKRISWTRAATAVARGVLTMSWSMEKLAEALTPRPEAGPPTTLAGFRNEFADALSDVEADRVVVLIDDLDRCLPAAVLSTLEAVKLFLAVPKMAFVIAADQDMVREAIAVGLGETRRSVVFARDYLDKIVQVPIGVPQPSRHDAECYVALLLASREFDEGDDIEPMVAHADRRRQSGDTPYLAGLSQAGMTQLHLHNAQRIVSGLATDDLVNPRRLKRFINALAVRQHTAAESGVVLDASVIAKLYMLEHRFPNLIRSLAERSQADRDTLLTAWEGWAAGAEVEGPEGADEALRDFFIAEPVLAGQDTEAYFVLARKLLKGRFSAAMSDDAVACIRLVLSTDPAAVKNGTAMFEALGTDEQRTVVGELVGQASTVQDPGPTLRALVQLAESYADNTAVVDVIRARRSDLSPGVAFLLVSSPVAALTSLAQQLATDAETAELARRAIVQGVG